MLQNDRSNLINRILNGRLLRHKKTWIAMTDKIMEPEQWLLIFSHY